MSKPRDPASGAAIERIPTGVPGLDTVLGGGLLGGGLHVLNGPGGVGKTVLSSQILFHAAARGLCTVYVTLLAESHDRMLAHLSGFRFFNPEAVGDGVYVVSGQGALATKGLDGLLELAQGVIRERRASILVIDGVSAIKSLSTDDLGLRRFLYGLHTATQILGCATLLVSDLDAQPPGPELPIADGLIEMRFASAGLRTVQRIEVRKLRGTAHLRGQHSFEITDAGVVIYPRLEAVLARPTSLGDRSRAQISTGVPGLDRMLGGGVAVGTATLVLGTSGTGKTLLGFQFLHAGAERGEPGLYFGLHETSPRLIASADEIGLRLSDDVDSGRVELLWSSGVEEDLDRIAARILEAVRAKGVKRVVFDGCEWLRVASGDAERVAGFLTALMNELRGNGITVWMLTEIPGILQPDVKAPIESLSTVTDSIILMRCVEIGARLQRMISVVKTRTSPNDHALRSMTIGPRGIEVGEVLEDADGLLGGSAHRKGPPSRGAGP